MNGFKKDMAKMTGPLSGRWSEDNLKNSISSV
jgi:hypothetical protein